MDKKETKRINYKKINKSINTNDEQSKVLMSLLFAIHQFY